MTTIAVDAAVRPPTHPLTARRVVGDVLLVAWRNLRKFSRNRRLMVMSTIQPVLQLIMFAFVFGAVASVPGLPYKQFVVPGVLVQAVVLAAMRTGVAVSDDLDSGMMDRFRSLPIARSAVLVGRTVSDTARLGVQAVLLVVIGIAIGFRFDTGVLRALATVLALVAFGLALTAFSGWVGLNVDDPETAQTSLMVPMMPLIFTSTAFAPLRRLPGWMQPIAQWNPVTAGVDLTRSLSIGGPLVTPFIHFTLWVVGITVVFTALGVRRFRRV